MTNPAPKHPLASDTRPSHDHFIHIERMTPEAYENGGKNLRIDYQASHTPFGKALVASTPKGVCYLAFADNEAAALEELRHIFPQASYNNQTNERQQNALRILTETDRERIEPINLHLKGTAFQLKIWELLLKIPFGTLTTYGDLAKQANNPKASRAVGMAVGSNPVSFLIPCHRVVRSSGALGGYHWGLDRKVAMLEWEASSRE